MVENTERNRRDRRSADTIGGLGQLWDGNRLLVLSALLCNQLGIFLDQKLICCPVNECGSSLSYEC